MTKPPPDDRKTKEPAAAAPAAPDRALAPLDPRRHAFRADLAAQALFGKVNAPRYVSGTRQQVVRPAVPLRRTPTGIQGFDTEVLFGETVTVYDQSEGWAWVQLDHDGYVGYLPADTLTPEVRAATHRVKAPGTFVYPVADIKAPPLMHLSINARLAAADADGRFVKLDGGGFVYARHVIEASRYERDFVEVAERLVDTPYLWGGKTRIGLDCSGLVQLALHAAGRPAPRDSDMQQAEIGSNVLVPETLEGLERGDLVFWKGHVGIMTDGLMLLHANAHHMQVVVETLPDAVARIAKTGVAIAAIKRLQGGAAGT